MLEKILINIITSLCDIFSLKNEGSLLSLSKINLASWKVFSITQSSFLYVLNFAPSTSINSLIFYENVDCVFEVWEKSNVVT